MIVSAAAIAGCVACKQPSESRLTAQSGSGAVGTNPASSPAAASGSTVAAADSAISSNWTIESDAAEPRCGDQPIPLAPAIVPTETPVDIKLKARPAIASCQDQPSVAATCNCLAATIASWGDDLSPKGECVATTIELDATAVLVQVKSVSADPIERVPGEATILVAKRRTGWSAVAVVATAADVKQRDAPGGSEKVTVESSKAEPIVGGTLYWIVARNDEHDHRLGKLSVTSATEGTICRISSNDASCLTPVVLAAWSYEEHCKVHTLGLFHATVTPTTVTVRVEHGKQSEPIAGTYHI